MQCPPRSGFLVELAVTIHNGTAFVFASQNTSGTGSQSADRAAFRTFLAGIRFKRWELHGRPDYARACGHAQCPLVTVKPAAIPALAELISGRHHAGSPAKPGRTTKETTMRQYLRNAIQDDARRGRPAGLLALGDAAGRRGAPPRARVPPPPSGAWPGCCSARPTA
jgi:hypothetical protein